MWAMLITNLKKSKDGWLLEFKNITADEHSGSCRLEAHYTLSSTGRKVHNIIDAEFQFKDGLIIKHTDSFEFYRWAKMGFGFTGWLLGWTSFFQKKVQARVSGLLKSFMERS